MAALLPRISLALVAQARADGHTRIVLRIANHGYLGSCGLPSAQGLPHVEPLRLTAGGDGLTVLAPSEAVLEIGHLEGWGGGLHGGPSVFSPWTRGNGHERFVTLLVAGNGRLTVTLDSCRVGRQQLVLDLG